MPNPADDGITHINIYSRGKTELGRLLSNFARIAFTCEDGSFQSIEGYWYWLGAAHSTRRNELRTTSGFEAKRLGRELRAPDWQFSPEFQQKILRALKAKLTSSKRLIDLLFKSTLPFEHYYIFGTTVRDEKKSNLWILEFWEKVRSEMKAH